MEEQNLERRQERKKSDIEIALEEFPSLQDMEGDMKIAPNIPDAYLMIRNVERAYEQLQKAGEDVSKQLRERRYQILEYVVGAIDCALNEVKGTIYARNNPELRSSPEFEAIEIGTLRQAIALLEEYTQKIDPNTELDQNDVYFSF